MLYKKLPGSYAPARYYRNHQLQFINFINQMHANCFKYQISVIKQRNSPTLLSLISDAQICYVIQAVVLTNRNHK